MAKPGIMFQDCQILQLSFGLKAEPYLGEIFKKKLQEMVGENSNQLMAWFRESMNTVQFSVPSGPAPSMSTLQVAAPSGPTDTPSFGPATSWSAASCGV